MCPPTGYIAADGEFEHTLLGILIKVNCTLLIRIRFITKCASPYVALLHAVSDV